MNRWGIKYHDDEAYMDYCDDGQWVCYEDAEAMQAELSRYKRLEAILRNHADASRYLREWEERKPPYPFCYHPEKCIDRCERTVNGERWVCNE